MRLLVPSFLLIALACSGLGGKDDPPDTNGVVEQDADADADADTDTDTDADGDTDPGEQDPVIISFTTNTGALQNSGTIVFSAIVTDPQGIDDLIGGQLIDPSGGTYGTFSTASEEGAYSLSVSWGQMNTVRSIEFGLNSNESRTFRAQFYDVSGHTTTADVSVRLSCSDAEDGACDGSCINLTYDGNNCGECDHTCGGEGWCEAATCHVQLDCSTSISSTCNQLCVQAGYTCVDPSNSEQQVGYVYDAANCRGGDYAGAVARCNQVLSTGGTGVVSAICYCVE